MVEIYIKNYCPYCHKAVALLDSLNIKYNLFDVTDSPEQLKPAIAKSGITTVPQIFSNGKFIGGCDDIHALHREGKLISLLK